MYYRNFILISFICLLSVLLPDKKVLAQQSARDSLNISMFYPAYSIALPFGDLKERFGLSHTIGGGYTFLTKSRWMFTAEGNFLFGGNVKNRSSVLAGIMTSDGHVINEEGTFANLAVTERGYTFWIKTGRVFPFKKLNPNSGILVMAGAGMLQHKIRIDVSQNNTPQLRSDYKKGYDRLCNGPAITQFIGYQHIDNNKRLNFFGGIEIVEAWTKSRRSYYFAERLIPNEKRFDMQVGIKIGWLVPLYRKTGREYYYY
jgi:hypothetical protein